jgi:hypothetical protein
VASYDVASNVFQALSVGKSLSPDDELDENGTAWPM